MKKNLFLGLGAFASFAAPVATLVACGSDANVSYKVTPLTTNPQFVGDHKLVTGKKLTAIVSDPENPRWQNAKTFLKTNGDAVGFTTTSGIEKDQTKQNTYFAANEADAYIYGATTDGAAAAWASLGKGKPVIAYDRLVHTANRTAYNWYVTFDNSEVGRLQGAFLLGKIYNNNNFTSMSNEEIKTYVTSHKLSKKQVVLAMGGDPADNNAQLFYNGGMNLIKSVAHIDNHISIPEAFDTFSEVSNGKWDYAAGKIKLQTAIGALSASDKASVAAVLSPNDGMATSAISALKENGLDPQKIWISGQDSNDSAILSIYSDSGQDMTILKPDSHLSAVAATLAAYLINNPNDNTMQPNANARNTMYASVREYIKNAFGTSVVISKISASEYDTATNDQDTRPINTILLKPTVITKSNYAQFFKVKKA